MHLGQGTSGPFTMRLLLFMCTIVVACAFDYASEQLNIYKKKQTCPVGVMTSSNGAPVEIRDTLVLNRKLVSSEQFMDMFSHLMEERIPERIVHAKGGGAFGYFKVLYNVTQYCKAKFLSEVGKITPVAVRMSHSGLAKGAPDTTLDSIGMAIRFYTEQGNFDMVGFHTPMFTYKEPYMTHPIFKTLKKNPVTDMPDPNMFWDVITLNPETINCIVYLYGINGIPNGFRHMPCHSIHTYQIYNKFGESYFARIEMIPNQGVKNLCTDEAMRLASIDPDYMNRDLYNAIECGNYPSWTVGLQLLTLKDVKKAKFDYFDITKVISKKLHPLIIIGILVLNKNPTNHFAQTEQLAFCPGNLVPGILGAPDKAFEARRLGYKIAQRYRLGGNFNRILVNCPLSRLNGYNHDGRSPVAENGGSGPNYYPNSFHGPIPYVDKNRPELINVTHVNNEYDNFMQATERYEGYSEKERNILVNNVVVWSLGKASKEIQQRVVKMFYRVHHDLGKRLEAALRDYSPPFNPACQCLKQNEHDNMCV